ncbi:Uncharacterised protein [Mycobacteroides abscessus]|nr:Uncharacterised protein [Mycobacteroides abscessus]
MSWPSTDGVSAGARIDVVGRLPGKVRALTRCSAVPSARTSSAVLPNASALVWAKKFARNRPCTSAPGWTAPPSPTASTRGWAGFATAMKSAGMRRVPWWMSW